MDPAAVTKAQESIRTLAEFHDALCSELGLPPGTDPEKILAAVRETVAYAINK
jgi:hypothetical protein